MITSLLPRCVIVGAGAHAAVLLDVLQQAAIASPVAMVDADAALWGTSLCGVPIRGGDVLLPALRQEGVTHFAIGVGSVGSLASRIRLFAVAIGYGLLPLTVCHPTAYCSPYACIGEGTQLLPQAIVNTFATIGENGLINTGAIIEHHCKLAAHVHVATGARLCGGVNIGLGTHIGAGAVVKQGISIGADVIIGAGAVVIRDVPAHLVVVGVPAHPLPAQPPFKGIP